MGSASRLLQGQVLRELLWWPEASTSTFGRQIVVCFYYKTVFHKFVTFADGVILNGVVCLKCVTMLPFRKHEIKNITVLARN